MKIDKRNLVNALKEKARQEGFADVGIAPATLAPETGSRLKAWVAEGCHGDMLWMEGRMDERAQPAVLWDEVRSVIMLGMSYAPEDDPMRLADQGDRARISIYAQGKDYHKTVKGALKRTAQWLVHRAGNDAGVKVFVDTAPVMEKALASAAGIGWQGKHTNVVSRDLGSWFFIGSVFTTLDLPNDTPEVDRCGSCRSCLDACPTDAFPAPYQLDARRCISYLTIELKGSIPESLRPLMGNRIYGCDDCLAVCPWNKFADTAHRHIKLAPRAELEAPELGQFLQFDDAGFRQFFSGSPIKRIGRDRFVRNCLYAAGNSGAAQLLPLVSGLCSDPDPVVADAARWAAQRLTAA